MLSKIFFVLLGLSVVVMGFFTFYSWSWLQSIGQPLIAASGYEYQTSLAWIALWLSTVVLILLANGILWTTLRGWAMWTAFFYFCVFTAVKYFWLDGAYSHFKETNNFPESGFPAGPVFAVILIVLAGVIVFFDQFILLRLNRKMYPRLEVAEVPPEIADA